MEKFIETFLSWQLIMFCLSVSAVTFVFKKFITYGVKKVRVLKKFNDFWMEVLMPTIPVIMGGFMSYILTSYPFPPEANDTSSRVFFGIVAGMFSGLVYKIVKSFLTQKKNQNLAE